MDRAGLIEFLKWLGENEASALIEHNGDDDNGEGYYNQIINEFERIFGPV